MAGAGDNDALIIVSFMKADRMTAAFMCRYPLGGGILGDVLGLEGPADGFFGGVVFLSTYSWRRLLAAWTSGGLSSDVW